MQPRVRTSFLGYLLSSEPQGSFLKARAGGVDLPPTPCPASPSHSWFIGQTLSASLCDVNTTHRCSVLCKCPVSSKWHDPAGALTHSIYLSLLHSFPPRALSDGFLFQQHQSFSCNSSSRCEQREQGKEDGNTQGHAHVHTHIRTRSHSRTYICTQKNIIDESDLDMESAGTEILIEKPHPQCSTMSICVTGLEIYEEKPGSLASKAGLAQ